MLRDTRLILILVFAACGIGVSATILALLQELLEPFDVDNLSVGIMGMIYVLFGFLSGLAGSLWVRRVHNLGPILRLMLLIAVIGLLGICLVLNLEIIYVFGIFLAAEGIGIIGFMPAAIEACIERLDHENLVTTTLFFIV